MKVKVIKANKPTYWYSLRIGEIFEVEDEPITRPHLPSPRYLLKRDCVLALDVDDVVILDREFVFR